MLLISPGHQRGVFAARPINRRVGLLADTPRQPASDRYSQRHQDQPFTTKPTTSKTTNTARMASYLSGRRHSMLHVYCTATRCSGITPAKAWCAILGLKQEGCILGLWHVFGTPPTPGRIVPASNYAGSSSGWIMGVLLAG